MSYFESTERTKKMDWDIIDFFIAVVLLSSTGFALIYVFRKVTPARKQVVLTLIILLTLILIWVELAVGILYVEIPTNYLSSYIFA